MTDIPAQLDTLLVAFQSKGIDPDANLNAGLSEVELDRYADRFGVDFPADVRALYSWRNGLADVYAEPEQLFLFRDQAFLSLDDAMMARDVIHAFLAAFSAAGLPVPFSEDSLLPIGECEGQYYAVLVGPADLSIAHANPIVSIGEGLSIYFHSIAAMLATCIEWVNDAQYTIEIPEPADELTAWEKYNPGVLEIEI